MITKLSPDSASKAIWKLIRDADLKDSEGNPLRVTVGILRKTFINRVYELLEGDVAATAIAAGNTVQVAERHYLLPTQESANNWRFMGAILVNELLTNTIGRTERTPVGQCTDNRMGERAPKKEGAVCMSFMNCVRCANYVVTTDDLFRLFSFYWRVLKERSRIGKARWQKNFAHIIRLIDRDIVESGIARGVFNAETVATERARARSSPHPFWAAEAHLATVFGAT